MTMDNNFDDDYQGPDPSDAGDEYASSLKPGTFRARAIEAALGESASGNPQVAVSFQILDEGYENERINWYGSFSKNLGKGKKTPFQRTIESLRAAGWESDDLSELSTVRGEVSLVLEYETYEGKRALKVKWVNRQGGLALKAPMNETQSKAFAARMKGEVIAASKSIPKPASSQRKFADDPADFPPREDEGY